MPGSRRSARAAVVAVLCAVAAGCGGEDERQDADEPSGTFEVEVVAADFPERQRLAQPERLVLEVRNAGARAVPNIAATVSGFEVRDAGDEASGPRPVWIVDDGPAGGGTAYVGTWALGRLEPGRSRRFVWRVTAVVPGSHELRWRIAAGLDGHARAVTTAGRTVEGRFDVRISPEPAG